MKTQIGSLLTSVSAASASFLIMASPAQAGYVLTLQQVGPNVVATGSGAIDLTALTLMGSGTQSPLIDPMTAAIYTGTAANSDAYSAPTMIGPMSFGSGSLDISPTTSSGDIVGKVGPPFPFVSVPHGYLSNTPLSDTSTYDSATFATLGVTVGTYEWTWGAGPNQNFTLEIGVVPEPSVPVLLSLAAVLLFAAKRLRCFQQV